MKHQVARIHPADSVLVALVDLPIGTEVPWNGGYATVTEPVPAKHKLAPEGLAPGQDVTMYGVLFTTGLGTPAGNPIAPVVKIASNTALARRMPDIIDLNTGTVIDGEETIEQAGERILDYVIRVASGEKVAAVRHDQTDFIPWKRGGSL